MSTRIHAILNFITSLSIIVLILAMGVLNQLVNDDIMSIMILIIFCVSILSVVVSSVVILAHLRIKWYARMIDNRVETKHIRLTKSAIIPINSSGNLIERFGLSGGKYEIAEPLFDIVDVAPPLDGFKTIAVHGPRFVHGKETMYYKFFYENSSITFVVDINGTYKLYENYTTDPSKRISSIRTNDIFVREKR